MTSEYAIGDIINIENEELNINGVYKILFLSIISNKVYVGFKAEGKNQKTSIDFVKKANNEEITKYKMQEIFFVKND